MDSRSRSTLACRCRRNRRGGFSLGELMIVIAIICVLVSIAIPSYQRAKSEAQLTACVQNLRSIGVAYMAYLNDHPAVGGIVSNWDRIVPDYLAKIPTCPSTGKARGTGSGGYTWYYGGRTVSPGVYETYTFVVCSGGHKDVLPARPFDWGPFWTPRVGINDGRSADTTW